MAAAHRRLVVFPSGQAKSPKLREDWFGWLMCRLLAKNFQHCLLVDEHPDGAIVLEFSGGWLTIKRLKRPTVERWPAGWRIFSVDRPENVRKRTNLTVLTCTGLVAAIVGVGHGLTTPRALHRRLSR